MLAQHTSGGMLRLSTFSGPGKRATVAILTMLKEMHLQELMLKHHRGAKPIASQLDLIELSTRHNFVYWGALGAIYRGWARSASGDNEKGIRGIEHGIRDYRATGAMLSMPFLLTLKAEALHLADRTSEALEAISEADELVERFEERRWRAELHRLRGVFLTAIDVDAAQIEGSFSAAIRIAREQKSISLQNRAEATYAEYHRQKASVSGGRGFRLPLC
jgi:hypothetical protein